VRQNRWSRDHTAGAAKKEFLILSNLEKDLLRHGLKTINVCPCQEGCPSCVGPSRETGRQAKQVAQEILRGLLEE